jgi:hypothetical protein
MRLAIASGEHQMLTQHQLNGYLGRSIADICPNGYIDDTANHGAHFVAHMMGSARGAAASLRVQDLFQRCPKVGVWSLRPSSMTTCLVFVSRASNVHLAGRGMAGGSRQQVGLLLNGSVWHYSNRQRTVVRQTPAQFSRHYAGPDNALFYGSLP